MKATDITWGGEAKSEFRVESGVPSKIRAGMVITLEYDYVSTKYYMLFENSRYYITPTNVMNKSVLEDCVAGGDSYASLIRVIDVQDKNVTVQIHRFLSIIEFNSLQQLKIQISDAVVEKMPKYARTDPLKFIKSEFMFEDNMVFVIGIGKYERDKANKSFVIISKTWRLTVARNESEYIANNLSYNSHEIDKPVSILRGCIEFVDATQSADISREVSEKLSRIANPDSYFSIWDAYNELEKLLLFKQAVEHGVAEYTSYEVEVKDAFIYKFKLKENSLEDLEGDDTQMDCTDNDIILKMDNWESLGEIKDFKPISVGNVSEIGKDRVLYVVDKNGDSKKKLPKSGYLFKSISGDKARIQRRIDAKEDIASGRVPLPHLALLINDGVSSIKPSRNEQAVTNMLIRKVPQSAFFNEAQKKAVEVALNTPDIALIQGPPGTGKTTVIRAIIARFQEYFQKNNPGEIPSILVTSFQHEAVENVIDGMIPSGLPANRIGGRRGEEQKQQASVEAWVRRTVQRCEELAKVCETPKVYNSIKELKDVIFAWYSKGKDLLEGVGILKVYTQANRMELSYELVGRIDRLFTGMGESNSTKVMKQIENADLEDFIRIISQQRLSLAAFEDDGPVRALELKYAIEEGLVKGEKVPGCLLDVISQKGKDAGTFKRYMEFVKMLEEKYVPRAAQDTASRVNTEEVEHCMSDLLKELEAILLAKRSNREEAVSRVLYEYMDQICNPKEVRRLINRYSNIRAATCQQAMELGRNAKNSVYDLVIVDEAARANPLDLFIPMSMGRQIILVGDHKQLPHLLEPEVVKKLNQDEKLKELNILGKSLFERMFGIFEEQRKTGGFRRTCQLNKQYRMHPLISEFVSEAFYGTLECGLTEEKLEERKLKLGLYNGKPVVWIDVGKQKYGIEDKGRSKSRQKEAKILIDNVKDFLKENERAGVGIITFYRKQKELIEALAEVRLTSDELQRVSIGTVDAFQGKEFDAVFLSCVRSNNESTENLKARVGFVNDVNRLCVSLSRAKSLLVVVGDSETVDVVPSLKKLVELCRSERGHYISG